MSGGGKPVMHNSGNIPKKEKSPQPDKKKSSALIKKDDESVKSEKEKASSLKKGDEPFEAKRGDEGVLKYESEKHSYEKSIQRSLAPIKFLFRITGRFPLKVVKEHDAGREIRRYKFSLLSLDGLYYVIVTLATLYIMVMVTLNITDSFIHITFDKAKVSVRCQNQRLFELVMFDRYLVGSVVIWTAFAHILLGSVALFFKRKSIAYFFSIWSTIASKSHINLGEDLYKTILGDMFIFFASIAVLIVMTLFRLTATVTGETSYFSLLLFRLYEPCMLNRYDDTFTFSHFYYVANGVATFLFFFIFVASKSLVFFFLFFCRMIKLSFMAWNGRFFAALLYTSPSDTSSWGRTTNALLFEDHCHLLNLVSGADNFFTPNIELYFALQIVSLIFEAYSILRFGKYGSDTTRMTEERFYLRRNDWIPGMIIFLVNLFLLFLLLKASADVEEEAMVGLEIIRRKTVVGSRSEEERDFILSVFNSFTNFGGVGLVGGGYFRFNRELFITVGSLFFSCFIVTCQFQPTMDYNYDLDAYDRNAHFHWHGSELSDSDWLLKRREDVGAFVRDVEGLSDRHWGVHFDFPNETVKEEHATYCVLIHKLAPQCPVK